MAVSPAQSLVLLVTSISKCENILPERKSTHRKEELRGGEERQRTADIVQTLRLCHARSQRMPSDILFVSQQIPIATEVHLTEVSAICSQKRTD